MYAAGIFDLDGTLYDYDQTHGLAMLRLQQQASALLDISTEAFIGLYERAKREVKVPLGETAASHNRALYMQRVMEIATGRPRPDWALVLYNAYWDTFIGSMQLFSGVLPLFQKMRQHGMKIAICTDMTAHTQFRKLCKLGINDCIDVLVTSEEAGLEKPNPPIFSLCLAKLDLLASSCFYVGDHPRKDIMGAVNCGMTPILLSESVSGHECLHVQTFDALDAIIFPEEGTRTHEIVEQRG